jgi:hypothetical protein
VTLAWKNSSQEVNVQGAQPLCGHHKSCDPYGVFINPLEIKNSQWLLTVEKIESQLFHPVSS